MKKKISFRTLKLICKSIRQYPYNICDATDFYCGKLGMFNDCNSKTCPVWKRLKK